MIQPAFGFVRASSRSFWRFPFESAGGNGVVNAGGACLVKRTTVCRNAVQVEQFGCLHLELAARWGYGCGVQNACLHSGKRREGRQSRRTAQTC